MDFFSHQDKAKRQSRILLLYYILAICTLVVLTHVAVIGIFLLPTLKDKDFYAKMDYQHFLYPEVFGLVAVSVILVITLGTLIKIYFLREGGSAVAKSLGGIEIDSSTKDPHQRRLLNIVEEMSIASGIPLPSVFLLAREDGINAFAAGYTFNDAAIGVTKGCIETLSRDELQGVIAHEFSHILNSDMKLNIRLIGVLNGILGLYIIGRTLLRVSFQSNNRGFRRRDKSYPWPITLFAMALIIVGSLGALFARMIQSAISRQREFLADASAVQFTRNPNGIAEALKKIGGFYSGSDITHPHATEASHMFFAEGLSGFLYHLFSTHPPLTERIQKIDPSFKGKFPEIGPEVEFDGGHEQADSQISGFASSPSAAPSAAPSTVESHISISPQEVLSNIGTMSAQSIAKAQELIWAMPEEIKAAAHDPEGAKAIILSLLLSSEANERAKQLSIVTHSNIPNKTKMIVFELEKLVLALMVQQRLPLIDISSSILRKLTPKEYETFNELVTQIVQSDGALSLFEYILITILHHTVETKIYSLPLPSVKHTSFDQLLNEVAVVLSALAHSSYESAVIAQQNFDAGMEELSAKFGANFMSGDLCTLSVLNQALDKLTQASPEIKRRIVAACVRTISNDGKITVTEGELLRAVCEALYCPLPVFT